MKIILNGRERQWIKTTISYSEIATLTFPGMETPARSRPSTSYEGADQEPANGILSPRQSIKVKDGIIIHCHLTNKA